VKDEPQFQPIFHRCPTKVVADQLIEALWNYYVLAKPFDEVERVLTNRCESDAFREAANNAEAK
jgi:hypothetical protein